MTPHVQDYTPHRGRNVQRRAVVQQPEDLSFRLIPLTQGKVALVDADLFDYLSQWNWSAVYDKGNGKFYAVCHIKTAHNRFYIQRMHRMVLGLEKGDRREGDHIDPDETLDNRRSNLRIAEHGQNQANSYKPRNNRSGFKGVSWYGRHHKWVAHIGVSGKRLTLGYRDTPEAAYALYCEAAAKYHGDFHRV